MTTIGTRIRAARKRAKLSQDQLAQRVGVSRAAVGTWERDEKEPRKAVMKKLMVVLAMPASAFDRFGAGGIAVAPLAETSKVSQVQWSDIALMARGLPPTGAKQVLVQVTPVNPLESDEFRIIVVDDSMSPEINPGDVISFKSSSSAQHDDLVVAHVNGHDLGLLRYYRDRGGNTYDLWPVNPEYPTLTRNASTQITIVGVVFRHLRMLRRAANGHLST